MLHELVVHRKYLLFYCLQNFVVDIVCVRGSSRVLLWWKKYLKYWCQVATDFTNKYLSMACQETNNNNNWCERSVVRVAKCMRNATHWNANQNIFSNLTQHFNNTDHVESIDGNPFGRKQLKCCLMQPQKIILDNMNVSKSQFLSTFRMFACHCHATHLAQYAGIRCYAVSMPHICENSFSVLPLKTQTHSNPRQTQAPQCRRKKIENIRRLIQNSVEHYRCVLCWYLLACQMRKDV